MKIQKMVQAARSIRRIALSAVAAAAVLGAALPVSAADQTPGGPNPTPALSLLPDLQPTPINYANPLAVGKATLFDSGVKNTGQAPSSSFNVKWYVNGVQVGYGGHEGIASGATVLNGNSSLLYTFPAPGTYTITFKVDCDNHITEVHESNNITSITVTLFPVDLVPSQMSSSVSNPKTGQTVTFDSGVSNLGYANSGTFNVTWYINDVPVASGGHESVAGNSFVPNGNSRFDYVFRTPGTYKVTFLVDSWSQITEYREDNNAVEMYVTVTAP